jgi:hypothetical protein
VRVGARGGDARSSGGTSSHLPAVSTVQISIAHLPGYATFHICPVTYVCHAQSFCVVPCSSLLESGTALVAVAILLLLQSEARDWGFFLAFIFGGGFFTALALVGLGLSRGDGLGLAAYRISLRTPAGR